MIVIGRKNNLLEESMTEEAATELVEALEEEWFTGYATALEGPVVARQRKGEVIPSKWEAFPLWESPTQESVDEANEDDCGFVYRLVN